MTGNGEAPFHPQLPPPAASQSPPPPISLAFSRISLEIFCCFPPIQPSFVGFFFFFPLSAEEEELSVSVYFSLNITREQNSPMCWERDKVFRQQIQIFQSTQPGYRYSCQDSGFRAVSSRGVLFRLPYFFFLLFTKNPIYICSKIKSA